MDYILNKNNIGVDHICNGRYDEARKAFKAALMDLTAMEGQKDVRDETCGNIRNNSVAVFIEHRRIPDLASTAKSSTLYMYRRAICTRHESEGKENAEITTKTTESSLAMLITFNLTLTLQYKVNKEFEYGSNSWNEEQGKFLLLYKKVLKLLKIDTNKKTPQSLASYRDTVSLAVVNNMGGIFYQLALYQKAWGCFKSLNNTFKSQHGDVNNDNFATVVPSDVRDRIMVNIFLAKDKFEKSTNIVVQRPAGPNAETLNASRLPSACAATSGN